MKHYLLLIISFALASCFLKKSEIGTAIILEGTSSAGKTSILNEIKKINGNKYEFFNLDSFLHSYKPFQERQKKQRESTDLSEKEKEKLTENFISQLINDYYSSIRNEVLKGKTVFVDTVPIHDDVEKEDTLIKEILKDVKMVHVLLYCPLKILFEHVETRNISGKEKRYTLQAAGQFQHLFKAQEQPTERVLDHIPSKEMKELRREAIKDFMKAAPPHTSKEEIETVAQQQEDFYKEYVKQFKLDELEEIPIAAKKNYDLILDCRNTPIELAQKIFNFLGEKMNNSKTKDALISAHEALEQFLKADTISCKLISGGMDEGTVVKCSHDNTNYIIKLFQDTAIGKNEALWTEFASHLGIGPIMYYADPAGTYFIIKFVEGSSLTPNIINNSLILQNIAKNISLLHQSSAPFAYKEDIFTRIENKYKSLQTSGALQNLLVSFYHYIEKLKANIRTAPVKLVPCHNDLNPRNVFVKNKQVIIIDWGDASMSNPYYDISAFFILNSLTPEQETIFLTKYDVTLLKSHWQSYLSMLKQVVRFEFALNLLRGVQELKKDLLTANKLPQIKSLQYYLSLFAEQQVPTDASFIYAMALASLDEICNLKSKQY